MGQTKARPQEDAATGTVGIPAEPQKADDQTALDDIAKRKSRKEKLPKGYKERLPAGTIRQVSVAREKLGKRRNKVFRVVDTKTGEVRDYDKVKIEGESEMVLGGCDNRGVHLETDAAILVGRGEDTDAGS